MSPRPARSVVAGVAALAVAACRADAPLRDPDLVVTVDDLAVSSADVRFVAVRDAIATESGVWLLDEVEPFLTLVTPTDEVGHRFGRAGRGPSELLLPVAIQSAVPPSSDVLVWDPGNARVVTFGADGSLKSVTAADEGHSGIRSDLPDVTYVDPYRVRRVGDRFAFERYPSGLARTADLALGRLVLAGAPDLFGSEPLGGQDDVAPFGARLGELGALPLWDACPDRTIARWAPDLDRLVWLDVTGSVRSAVPVPHQARDLTTREIENYLRHMARLETGSDPAQQGIDVAAMARRRRDLFAREAPLASELRCGAGEAWLRVFDASSDPLGRGSDWIVVRAGGLTRVRLPETFSPLLILPDRVVGVLDRDDGQWLAWWPRPVDPRPSSPKTLE